jgi:hypothetical protein
MPNRHFSASLYGQREQKCGIWNDNSALSATAMTYGGNGKPVNSLAQPQKRACAEGRSILGPNMTMILTSAQRATQPEIGSNLFFRF